MLKRLTQVSVGQKAIIRSFDKDEIFLKLMEMGCVPGESVTIDLVAPLGDPISISIAGYNLSLRLEEANKIWVEVVRMKLSCNKPRKEMDIGLVLWLLQSHTHRPPDYCPTFPESNRSAAGVVCGYSPKSPQTFGLPPK